MELICKRLKICENCEWCIPHLNSEFPHCLLVNERRGLFNSCDNFKQRTGNHISM